MALSREALERQYEDEVVKLWKEHADGIRKQVHRWGAFDAVEADDVTQDAFLVARRRWAEWRSQREPVGYLYKTAKNILKWRQTTFRRELGGLDLDGPAERPFGLPEEAILREDLKKALWALSERQRQVVVLRYFYDFDLAATAEYLGLSQGTVKSHASKGLERLRGLMEGYDPKKKADR